MAAILQLRRGATTPTTLSQSELFYNTTDDVLIIGDGGSTKYTLVKIGSNTGGITLSGDLIIGGNSILNTITGSSLHITGDSKIDGNLRLGGNIFLGSGSDGDLINVNASLSGSLIPETTNQFDLGSIDFKYKNLYVVSASIDNISLDGSGILSSSNQTFNAYSSSIESQLDLIYIFTQSATQRLDLIENFTQSVDLRVNKLEASQSYFDNTYSSSVDSRLVDLELTGSDHESRLDIIETTFSSSVDSRLDSLELSGSLQESRFTDLEFTSSNQENRIDNLESSQSYFDNTFSSSVDSRLDSLEFFSSSEYQLDSSSFHNRIVDLTSVTGSYATTGSNLFIGNQTITGSLKNSGSVEFQGLPWPTTGFETHFLLTQPYSHNGRSYDGAAIGLELTSSFGTVYENSILIHNWDNHTNPDYGTEVNIGSNRAHIMAMASGSNRLANVSVEDVGDETTRTLVYGDDIQIGVYTGSTIEIGNTNSVNTLRGNITNVVGTIDSTHPISASEFYGDGSNLLNVTASYVEYAFIGNKPPLVSGSSQINVNQTENFQTFSSSVDSRLDQTETSISSIHSYTSSLKSAINVNGQNLTILGDLVVQGDTTTINTSQLVIEDKVLAIASGSIDSSTADGAGFFISGANSSILWNHSTQTLDFNTKVSSSIGFKGDGSELTDLQYTNLDFDGSGIVSGSSQIDLTLTTKYISGIKDRLNIEGVFSSSVQVNADSIINFDSNVEDYLVSENVHRGSDLGTATTTQLDEGTNFYFTDARVKTKLNAEGVISSSAQVNADSITNFDTNVKDKLNLDGLISGSSQVLLYSVDGFTSFSSSVDSRLDVIDGLNVYTESNDLRVNSIESFTESIDTRVDDLEFSSSNHENRIDSLELFSSSLDNQFLNTNGDNVVSGSSQINVNDTQNFQTFSSSVDTRLDSLETDQHTHSNKSQLDTINQDLSNSDSPTFSSLTLTNLTNEPTSSQLLQGVLYSGSGELVYSQFGDSVYYNVSNSIDDGNPEVLGNAGAVKAYVDGKIIEAGSGDITEVIAGNGLTGGATVGAATLTLDTGSTHFIDGVNGVVQLGDGIVSSSSQISAYNIFAELNGDGLVSGSSQIQLNSVSGFTTFSSSIDSRLDSLELFSSSLDDNFVTQAELASATGSLQNSINTKLDSSSFNSYTQSTDIRITDLETTSSNQESRLDELEANFSSSVDTRLDNLESFSSSIDITIKTKLNTEGVFSSSLQITNGSGIVSSSAQIDTLGFLQVNGDGVVSGSGQIVLQSADKTGFTGASSITTLGTVTSGNVTTILPTGVVSGSSQIVGGSGIVSSSAQISSYGVFAELNGDNLVSSSAQVKSLLPAGTVSGSSQVSFNSIVDKPTLFSESIQIDVEQTTNYDQVVNISGSQTIVGDKTFGGTQNFNNITVNGTGSFAFIESVTGSSTNIGEAFIVLNENTPASNFAGLKVIDSGSNFTTASFLYDGLNNQWVFEHEGSEDSGSAVAIFGPLSQGGLGTEQGLTENRIPKAVTDHGHHIGDSNITDSGTLITLGSNIQVNGNISITGTVDSVDIALLKSDFDTLKGKTLFSGSSQVSMGGDLSGTADNAQIVAGTITNTEVNATAGIVYTKLNLGGSGIVSGSSQVELTQTTDYISGIKTRLTAEDVVSGSATQVRSFLNVEDGADVTDTTNVTAAGALMDSELTSLSGVKTLTVPDNTTISTFGKTLVDDADAATARTTLGVDVAGTDNSTDVTLAGTYDYITISGQTITRNQVDASTDISNLTSTNVTEGTRLYYTDDRVKTRLNAETVVSGSSQVTLSSTVGYDSLLRSDTDDTASGVITFSNTTQSTSKTTGGVIVTGGVGIAKTLNVGEDVVAYASSDRRLKDEITPIPNSLQKINSIGGYSFVWNENQHIYKGKDYGVIAQEIEQILPELVETRENGYKAVKYDRIVSLLIEGIKELSKEVSELKEKIGK